MTLWVKPAGSLCQWPYAVAIWLNRRPRSCFSEITWNLNMVFCRAAALLNMYILNAILIQFLLKLYWNLECLFCPMDSSGSLEKPMETSQNVSGCRKWNTIAMKINFNQTVKSTDPCGEQGPWTTVKKPLPAACCLLSPITQKELRGWLVLQQSSWTRSIDFWRDPDDTVQPHADQGLPPLVQENKTSHAHTILTLTTCLLTSGWTELNQFSSIVQSCPTLCAPMNRSTLGLPVHHQLQEFTQIHVHRVSDAIQPSHPLSSPSPPAPHPSQHQSLFQWVNSSHEVAKILEFQL